MFTPGERIGVAVSGGADSVYLLHHLRALGLTLTVLHVNHKLRAADSDADETFVRALSADLHLPILVNAAHPPAGNLEEEAREARYSWFRDLIRAGVVDRVALGHTLSDQAETVLYRFLRGAGSAGLAAIRPVTSDGIVRPLLNLSGDDIRASLRLRGITWREDASNADSRFARNRIRHHLMPQLQRDWNPAIAETLAHTAEWALGEEEYWSAEIRRLAESRITTDPPYVLLRRGGLAVAAERRLIRHAIELAKGDLKQIGFSHVEQIRELRAGRTRLPGLEAEQSFEWLRIGPPRGTIAAYRKLLQCPCTVYIRERAFRFELAPAESVYNKGKQQLDWGRISGPLELRNWRPGDRYKRVGHSSEDKVKVLFQKARVPVWERPAWPVLLCGGRMIWSRQFGPAADVARNSATRTVLLIRESECGKGTSI